MPATNIINLTKRSAPSGSFDKWKKEVLGSDYDLSLVFCTPQKSHELNLQYRNKDKEANVLSFPLTKQSGEIFIKLPTNDFAIEHLFIHALLHLKGLRHGSRMDSEEKKYLTLLIKDNGKSQTNSWTRHRDIMGASCSLRTKTKR